MKREQKIYNCDFNNALWHMTRENNKKYVVVTDPPFNIGYHYKDYSDKMSEIDYLKMLSRLQKEFDSCVFIHYPETLYKLCAYNGCVPNRTVSWIYNSNTPRQHRDICFYNITPDFKKVTQPYKNLNDKRIQKRIENGCKGSKLYDWWNINQIKNVTKNREGITHPCSMPLEVMKNIIGILPEDCIIIDPFCGSGTTALACKYYNREFIGFEIDKTYYTEAKERLEKYVDNYN